MIIYQGKRSSLRAYKSWAFSLLVGPNEPQFPLETHIHVDFGPFVFCKY